MKRILLSISLLASCALAPLAQTFSGGDGSVQSPYLISKAADLEELATLVTAGNTFADKMFSVTTDFTVSTTPAPMIGHTGLATTKRFAGTFDGNGHTISGLKFSAEKHYCGLFTYVDAGGVVKNLNLQSPTLLSGNSYGGFVAAASDGIVENCHVYNGSFESTNGSYKGGVVGYNKGLVKNCTYSGTVTATSNAAAIVGQNFGQVEFCSSDATIVSNAPNQSSVQFGGITAVTIKLNSEPHIYDCYFTGNIQGAIANNCGGITGTLSGADMQRCWNSGYIASTGSCGALVNSMDKGAFIKDCYNVGTVYDTFSESVGGLIGYVSTDKSELKMENCLNIGTLFTSILARHENMEFAGANPEGLTISNCFFDSQITGVCSSSGAMTTAQLTAGTAIDGFDPAVWTFAGGLYPRLAFSADTDQAILGATPILLADGQTSAKVTSDFTVSTANGVDWDINVNTAAKLNGNKVTVTRGDKKVDVVLTAYLGNYQKRNLVSVYPVIFQGQGSQADPYIIANAADLMKLSDATNAQALSFTGEYFKVTADLDMAGVEFVPMAFNSSELAFNGVFDGDGHVIRNLTLDSRTNSVLNVALFRTVYADGVIKNLTIDRSCKFDVFRNFAPFAANLYGTIENCRNYADIPTSNGFAGGIAYLSYGTDSRIINCYNEGNLTSTAKDGYMGGIVYTNEGLIENCQNNGNVTASAAASKIVAGIAASNKGTLKNVLNTGNISASAEVGGIVCDSKAGSSIINALSLGQVSAFTSRDVLGAIVGKDAGASIQNAWYDKQIVVFGNDLDGVTAMSTYALTDNALQLPDETWTKSADRYPGLKLFAGETASQIATMPVWFANDMRCDQLTAGATLSQATGLTWTVSNNDAFKIDGDKLLVTNTDVYNAGVLTAAYNGYTRSIDIAALANLFAGSGTEDDPYLIDTFADLKKLGDDIQSSGLQYGGKFFKVTADLDAAGQSFSPIAANVDFMGIFDGNNKTISNLNVTSTTDNTGVFGRVGADGAVRNLTIGQGSAFSGKANVGSIVGLLAGTVENCVNNAPVSASASTANIGGIIGQATGNALISNCVNNGAITSGKSQTGGIVGYANGTAITINNVTNTADITGTTKTGGIVGYMINTTLTGAVNDGNITGTTNAAGIVGYSKNTCAISGAKNHGDVKGATEIAGVLGYAYNDLTVADSYNTGNVTASSSTAGGIIGRGALPTITNCFNAGTITNTKASLSNYTCGAGGIIGRGEAEITDVYNVGTVSAEKNLGGFIGYYNLSSKAATFTRVYQAAPVVCTTSATSAGIFHGVPKKTVYTDAYYDTQLSSLTEADAQGVTTTALSNTTPGQAWTNVDGTLPILTVFADDAYARLYSAALFLADGDIISAVSKPFTVSDAYGITWSGDPEIFKIEGNKVTPVNKEAGDYTLTATLGDLTRTFNVSLKQPSAVTDIAAESHASISVVDGKLCLSPGTAYTVFSTTGATVSAGTVPADGVIDLPAGLYIVKTSEATAKVIVK